MSLPIETRGEDWSHYQAVQNYAARAAAEHLSFLGIKATEGMTYTDPLHAANKRQCLARGDVPISYHYADPGVGTAAAQAGRLINVARPVARRDGICLDLERVPSAMTQVGAHAWAVAWAREARRLAPGVILVAYLGGYAVNGTGAHLADEFDLWWHPRYASTGPAGPWPTTMEAAPAGNTTGWPYPHIHQWTPNYGGRDADVSVLTVDQLVQPGTHTEAFIVSASQFDQLMARLDAMPHDVMAYDQNGAPGKAEAWQYLQNAAAVLPLAQAFSAKAIAAEILAALPANPGGGPTLEEIGNEFEKRLRSVLGGLDGATP